MPRSPSSTSGIVFFLRHLPASACRWMLGFPGSGFYILVSAVFLQRNSMGPNRCGVGLDRRFSTSISLYLTNGARWRHSYYGRLIGSRMRCIEWRYFL